MQGYLPNEVIAKSKHGFGLPFGQWLKKSERLKEHVYGNMESLKSRGVFREQFIDELVDGHKQGHASYYGTMLWIMAMLEQWFQEHHLSL